MSSVVVRVRMSVKCRSGGEIVCQVSSGGEIAYQLS